MSSTNHPETFDEIVEWAYRTLPPQVRDLPDFPGIQVAEEPPEDVLKKKNYAPGTELLGCYSGIFRTDPQYSSAMRTSPDLIFVFRGPILRCSRGNLRAEVKEVVWHEVAHWLGHNEQEVKDLGLSTRSHPKETTDPKH